MTSENIEWFMAGISVSCAILSVITVFMNLSDR